MRQEREKMRGGQGPGTEGGWPEGREKERDHEREVQATERQERAAAWQRRTSPLPPFRSSGAVDRVSSVGLGARAGKAPGTVLELRLQKY